MTTHAVTRRPGEDLSRGITTAALGKPDYALASAQHEAYVSALRDLGLEVMVLDPLPGSPDAYFVEDTVIVTPEVAVITNPGAEARRGEVDTIESVLAEYRKTVRIHSPGTVDGGDVLGMGMSFFIGISERTNREGAAQLGQILEAHGYAWHPIPLASGLHLKSSVNIVGENTLLVTREFADLGALTSYDLIVVEDAEAYAANTLLVNHSLIVPAGFPKTRSELERLGMPMIELDTSEARKMDGGLTCMSIRF